MYIEKRWLVPAGLSLLLLSALFAVALLLLGSRFLQAPASLRPAEITSIAPEPKAAANLGVGAPISDRPSVAPVAGLASPLDFVPAAQLAPPAEAVPAAQTAAATSSPVGGDPQPGAQQPEEVVDISTVRSDETQVNTRGFGDIGLQLQGTYINGPVTMVHVSNEGNNNSTNVNTGKDNRIVSDQKRLQSNRSDGSSPPTRESTGGKTARRGKA